MLKINPVKFNPMPPAIPHHTPCHTPCHTSAHPDKFVVDLLERGLKEISVSIAVLQQLGEVEEMSPIQKQFSNYTTTYMENR